MKLLINKTNPEVCKWIKTRRIKNFIYKKFLYRIFHVLAREDIIQHEFTHARINVDSKIVDEFPVDTYILTAHLISRLKRENDLNNIKNIVNLPNIEGNTPIMIAVEKDRLDMLKLLFPFARLELRNEV